MEAGTAIQLAVALLSRIVAVVIDRRMKKQGMSWLRHNATAVVTLRADFLNEEWEVQTTV